MIFPLRFFPEDFYFFHPAPELLCGAGARVPFPMLISPLFLMFFVCFVGRLIVVGLSRRVLPQGRLVAGPLVI